MLRDGTYGGTSVDEEGITMYVTTSATSDQALAVSGEGHVIDFTKGVLLQLDAVVLTDSVPDDDVVTSISGGDIEARGGHSRTQCWVLVVGVYKDIQWVLRDKR